MGGADLARLIMLTIIPPRSANQGFRGLVCPIAGRIKSRIDEHFEKTARTSCGDCVRPAMIRYSVRGVAFAEIWFDEPAVPPMPDILILSHRHGPPAVGHFTVKPSLVTDLTESEDAIWQRIGKTCRYKIRRAQTKDGAACAIDTYPSDAAVDEFIHFFNRFALQKSLPPISGAQFSAVAGARRLRLTRADLNGSVVARHAYIATDRNIRLLHSASLFREFDAEMRAAIGRANRLLHWIDIVAMKNAGFDCMDWGGRFLDESVPQQKSINDFKREFGARPVEYYESWQPISALGHFYARMRPFMRLARDSLGAFGKPQQ